MSTHTEHPRALPNFRAPSFNCFGRVCALKGPSLIATLPLAALGDQCSIMRSDGSNIDCEVIGFHGNRVVLAPVDDISGVAIGTCVKRVSAERNFTLPQPAMGLVLDGTGKVLDRLSPPSEQSKLLTCVNSSPAALQRRPITERLMTGVKLIDLFTPIGIGQRLVVSAQAGLGKSTLLGMLTRNADVDIVVVALVGERGREVREFLDDVLGKEGRMRSIVVMATSDESPTRRLLAPKIATAVAEFYRDQGRHVLLLVDSLTRTARAIREIGIAAGELPVRQGYTASVYSELPKLLERAGTNNVGSITAFYTMLSTGEREPDALTDEIKSLVDGHIVLDQQIADWGLRPAIDPLKSLSRLTQRFHSREEQWLCNEIRRFMRRLRQDRDILLLGGTPDAELKALLDHETQLVGLLNQGLNEKADLDQTIQALKQFHESIK